MVLTLDALNHTGSQLLHSSCEPVTRALELTQVE
jgi:hypothetical protein